MLHDTFYKNNLCNNCPIFVFIELKWRLSWCSVLFSCYSPFKVKTSPIQYSVPMNSKANSRPCHSHSEIIKKALWISCRNVVKKQKKIVKIFSKCGGFGNDVGLSIWGPLPISIRKILGAIIFIIISGTLADWKASHYSSLIGVINLRKFTDQDN